MKTNSLVTLLAFDVGDKRIGVAKANSIARMASPLITIQNDQDVFATISNIISSEGADIIVVGLPRNLSGDDTAQTRSAREFAANLAKHTKMKVRMQDEALTSHKAEAELRSNGKQYEKGHIDALAATYILEDYLRDNKF